MPFFRKVDEEFEAPLAAPGTGSPSPGDGGIRLDLTDSERPVPRVGTGDTIELRANGVVHAVGEYRPD